MLIAAVFLAIYVIILASATYLSVHPPRLPVAFSLGQLGVSATKVTIELGGKILAGSWLPVKSPQAVAVLGHGYLMNRSETAPIAFYLSQLNVSCLIFDFIGHGSSSAGVCTLGQNERLAVRAACDWAREAAPGLPLVYLGSSMGAAAGALALAETPQLADAIILDSCYGRLDRAILGWWRFLGGRLLELVLRPTVWLSRFVLGFSAKEIDVAQAIAHAPAVPILFIHGSRDNLALPSDVNRVIKAAHGPVEQVWFKAMGHCEGRWREPELYNSALKEFFQKHVFEPKRS